jgi:hypothetical protein
MTGDERQQYLVALLEAMHEHGIVKVLSRRRLWRGSR